MDLKSRKIRFSPLRYRLLIQITDCDRDVDTLTVNIERVLYTYVRVKCLHRISHFNPIGGRDCAERFFTDRMIQKTDPFLQYYSAPLEFTFWDRAEKNQLDTAIFILKTSHRE